VAVTPAPRVEVQPEVRVGTGDANGLTGGGGSQSAVDQEMRAAIETERVKVDSQRR
jgi:hypothetical protein